MEVEDQLQPVWVWKAVTQSPKALSLQNAALHLRLSVSVDEEVTKVQSS